MRKPSSPARRRFLKTAAATALVGFGTPAYAYEWEAEQLEVVHREIRIHGWPAAAAGMRIGHLSDFHCQDMRAVARTARAVRMMLAQKPDLVLLTGDYITGRLKGNWASACADALAPLSAGSSPVYAVLGNHDWWCFRPEVVEQELTRVGIHVLRNRSVPLPSAPGVWLVGMDDRAVGAHDPITALANVPEKAVKLLLIHEPDYADEAPAWLRAAIVGAFSCRADTHSRPAPAALPDLRAALPGRLAADPRSTRFTRRAAWA